MSHNTTNKGVIQAMKSQYEANQWKPTEWSIVTDTDSYKVSMSKQYPPKTETVFSYIEARGGKFPVTLFFGLQMFLKKLERQITIEEVEFAKRLYEAHGEPFPYEGWKSIVEDLNGRIPIRIDAVDEGSVIPVKNALVRIWNTDPRFYWLTTWIETALLRAVWYPTTVATLSWTIKQKIRKSLEATADNDVIEGVLPFRLHDFGSRGVSSYESAMIGGMAHLVNFLGTDTVPGLLAAKEYYNVEMSPGFSIPAAEHSTITAWGREGEKDAYENMLNQFGSGLVAVVSDSYDFWNALEIWGTDLKEKIETMGGTLVVRPDSGDPTIVPVDAILKLGKYFGFTTNTKGYKVLPPYIRVIQGDGIDMESIEVLLKKIQAEGWSTENIAFGMGGGLLQHVNRDTMKWAMKCSAVQVDGQWRDVYKDPITDPGKTSKKGRLGLKIQCGLGSCGYKTDRFENIRDEDDELKPVFLNGKMLQEIYFSQVRDRADNFDRGLI